MSVHSCLILNHRGVLCTPISTGYDGRTMGDDLKDGVEAQHQLHQLHQQQLAQQQQHQMQSHHLHHQHQQQLLHHPDDRMMRNQQVYSASPVKTIVDKCNDAEEMYEISPYATFSVSGGRTQQQQQQLAKTPTRGLTTSTLDYTVQFKTFGHPEGEMNLNATAYPMLAGGGAGGGGGVVASSGHVKGKSSWHKQRYVSSNTDGKWFAGNRATIICLNIFPNLILSVLYCVCTRQITETISVLF